MVSQLRLPLMEKLKTEKEVIQNPTVKYLQGKDTFSQPFSFLSVTHVHSLPLLHIHPVFPPE